MSDSIRLHREHGVAPCLTTCPVCGRDTNEIALLGWRCDAIMGEVAGHPYRGNAAERVPAAHPCDVCVGILNGGGIIFICAERRQSLALERAQADSIVGRIPGGEHGAVLDIEAMRGTIVNMARGWWNTDADGNITLRDPAEWAQRERSRR